MKTAEETRHTDSALERQRRMRHRTSKFKVGLSQGADFTPVNQKHRSGVCARSTHKQTSLLLSLSTSVPRAGDELHMTCLHSLSHGRNVMWSGEGGVPHVCVAHSQRGISQSKNLCENLCWENGGINILRRKKSRCSPGAKCLI